MGLSMNFMLTTSSSLKMFQLRPFHVLNSLFKRSSRKILSLEEFLFRQRLLGVYRQLMRLIYKSHEKHDLIKFARDEFKINREEKDLNHRKYLLALGINRINDMMKIMGINGKEF